MDKAKLIAAIVERHKVRLDEHDPVFIVVDLNLMVLDEFVQKISTNFEGLTSEIAGTTGKMNLQTAQLLGAAEKVKSLMNALVEESKRNITSAAKLTKEALIVEMSLAAKQAVFDGVEQAVSKKIKESIGKIDGATGRLKESSDAIGRASWRSGVWMVFASFLAAVLVVLFQLFFLPSLSRSLTTTSSDAVLIKKGAAFEKLWPQLDVKTQSRIKALIEQQ